VSFTLKQLQIFVAVVTKGSTAAAARHLNISQPAVSSALNELEANLNISLFDRWKKRIKLNERGRALVPMARLLLANARELDLMFSAGGVELAGSLRLGASTTIAGYVIPKIVSSFAARYPKVKVEVFCRNKTGIISMIEDFSLDAGVIAGTCNHANLEVRAWLPDELCVFAGAAHPLAQKEEAVLSDLLKSQWVLREKGSGTRETFLNALPPNCKPLNVTMECDNLVTIKKLVENGKALSCISSHAIKRELNLKVLKKLHTPYLNLRRDSSILYHNFRSQSPVISAFLATCLMFEADR
jgi:DNA-binding transcriptional LysR family regulator